LSANCYRQAIESKNTTAAIFLLKARHGYRDIGPTDGGPDARVAIQVNIPAPMTAEQYARLISVTPQAIDREAA
jgi:hypothetical protein